TTPDSGSWASSWRWSTCCLPPGWCCRCFPPWSMPITAWTRWRACAAKPSSISDSIPGASMQQANAASRRFGLVIVGDEILSGRRQDKHFSRIVAMLAERGLQLSWAQFIGDDRQALTAAYRHSFASGDVVFSCGGIGGTPDDHTRQAAAAALGVELALHPEPEAAIAQRCAETAAKGQGSADMSTPENRQRLQMGMFPVGSEIVPNPYNRIPGFFIRDHTFVPGFPVMAWPMLEWTLDTRYAGLHHKVRHVEHSFLVFGLPES